MKHKHRYKFWGWGSVHTLENWDDWKSVYLFHCNCGDIQQVDPTDFWRTP